MNLIVLACHNDPKCQYQSTIDAVADSIVVAVFVAQNYFDIENYTQPIQTEVGLISPL